MTADHPPDSATGMIAPSERARYIAYFAIVSLACLSWFYFFDPAAVDAFLPCPFKAATDLDCPGCGTQRAIHQLLHGNPAAAWDANPMIVLILPLFTVAVLQWYARDVLGYRMRQLRMPPLLIAALVVALAVFWVWRNL